MWYINRIGLLICICILTISCGDREPTNADQVVGYWQVRAENKVNLNGIPHHESTDKFWVRFDELNVGQVFDEFENPTGEIRWSYENRDLQDRMLIFDKFGGGNSFDFYTEEFYDIMAFNDNNFVLFNKVITEIGDSTFSTGTFSFFVRQ